MRARREVTFELTHDLRDRVLNVRSAHDAAALLRRLGVRDVTLTGRLLNDFERLAGCIRSSESRYGRAPLDFPGDPLMGMGGFGTSSSRFWRRPDYERPVVGIRVTIGESSSGWDCVSVSPLRAEPIEVVIPEGITRMEPCGLKGCSRIRRVVLPSSMRAIPAGAFWGCSGLKEVVVPDGVTSIGPAAFADCEKLQRVVLPPSLEHVGCGAFRGCIRLEEVVAPAGFVMPCAADVFDGCKLPADKVSFQTSRPYDKARALDDLKELLDGFAHMCLDGPNSVHSFSLEEIETPDVDDVVERAGAAADAIHQMLDVAIDCAGSLYTDNYIKTTEDDLLLLSRLIVDTLVSIGGNVAASKVYECPGDLWDEYTETCFNMTGTLVIRVGDAWYVLIADWSD